ncbi:AAA family ATPase [Pseudactinotalea sp. HY160]|uniref:AAA family ATPase n=1 Tax=Pseudactinotalea sp. HY160 TaxID=2654490 RepID=UPI00128DCBAF|nr:AAA family ATPase [Pseudactinotalea sp. HY160]MPV50213.1 AAA family ATPase [Pseudactinotalea sp. HY160]
MRLERVRLRNFRGVSESVVDLSPGITIVSGPNEVGKSSVREAIRLLREVKHSSKSQAVKSVQPVGRDVGPEVEVHLSSGGYRMRYAKRWIRDAFTELEVSAPRHEQLSGDQAHDRFGQILAETVDLDLLSALDVAQGMSLERPQLAEIGALHAALDRTAAGAGHETGEPGPDGAGHDALLERIEAEYRRFFTSTGRPTGEYREIGASLPDLESAAADLREQSRVMDRRTNDHERESALLIDDQERIGRAGARLETWRARDRALEQLRERAEERDRDLAGAELARTEAAAAREAREELISALARRTDHLAAIRLEATDLAETARPAGERLGEARERARVAGTNLEEGRGRAARATKALERAQDSTALIELRRRLDRAREADGHRLTAVATLEGGPRVDASTLAGLTDLATRVTLARRAREAAAARVLVQPLGEVSVLVNGAAIDAPETRHATDAVTVEATGVLRVEIHPGAGPADLEGDLTRAEESLREALAGAGVASLAQARRVAEEQTEVLTARDRAVSTLTALLDGQSIPELAERAATLEARVGVLSEDPDASVDELRAAAAEAEEAAARAERANAEAQRALEAAQAASREAETALMRAQVAVEQQGEEHRVEQERLDRARSTLTDEAVALGVESAAAALDRAGRAAAAARAELVGADADRVELELTNADAALVSARERLAGTRERLVGVRALLEESAKAGIYDRLAAAEAELGAARAAHERLDRSARAIRLLRETIHRHRDEAHRKYVAPFRDAIDRLGRLVFGPEFGVQIDENLQIVSRTLGGDTVPFDSLSAGAREQLALLGRLACAQLIDADEGAPVILDDTLGFADAQRLEALNLVLATVGRQAQVVLFTCQEDRFTGVGGATTVRLPTL